MKKIMPHLVGVLFTAFVIAVFVGIVSMSFKGLGWIFPDDLFDQAIGLILFDVAALTWFLVLVYKSESTAQYVFALIGFMVGLLGTFGLIGIEVSISSGMVSAADMTRPLTYVFIAVFAGHLTLIYLFHGSAPHMDAKISLGIDKAKIVDEGRKQAEKTLGDQLPHLGAAISARLVAEVMKDLNLQPQIIDTHFLPLDANESPARVEAAQEKGGFGAMFFNAFKGVKKNDRKYEQAVSSVSVVAETPAPVANRMSGEFERQIVKVTKVLVNNVEFSDGSGCSKALFNEPIHLGDDVCKYVNAYGVIRSVEKMSASSGGGSQMPQDQDFPNIDLRTQN